MTTTGLTCAAATVSATRSRLRLGAAASALLMASAAPAFAQPEQPASSPPPAGPQPVPAPAASQASAPSSSADVVVTGSRIRGIAPVGSNVVTLSREQIVSTGAATTADILRTVPQIQGLGPSATAAAAQNGAANVTRGTGINLRGIGVNATLLLFDGHRFPAAGTQGQFTDPSVLPAIALERVEVVPDGASAIYGSDAVAGVVNLITRRNFSGLEATARAGFADGYEQHQVSAIYGRRWTGGSFTFAFEHTYNSALAGDERDFYTTDLRSRGGRDLRSNQCNPGNIVIAGVTYPIPAGGVTPGTASSLAPGAANLCDNLKLGYIIPSMERNTGFYSLRQDINETLTFFSEGFGSKRQFTNRNALTASLVVPSTNAFYVRPPGAPAGTSETLNYSFARDLGLNYIPGTSSAYEALAGLDIRLPGSWRAQVSASYGRGDDMSKARHNLNTPAINAALASSNPATALNVFGGTNSSSVLSTINNGYFVIKAHTGLSVLSAQADGPLFALPGGDVRVAVGTEYRWEQLVGNLISGSQIAPVGTGDEVTRHVLAGFAEVFVPIVGPGNAVPGIERLSLSIAGRAERYSDFGSTANPKVGVTWQPIRDVSVRASYGKSFRAPSLAESDPHSSGWGLYGDLLPNPRSPTGTSFGIGIAGGNPNLSPEEATTWSVGANWKPAWLPGLRADLTYFSVDYTNQIVGLRGTPGLLSLPFYAQYVIFNPTPAQVQALLASGQPINSPINASQVTFIADGRRQNLGSTLYRGFDFDLGYRWTTGAGDFDAGVNGTYFTKLVSAPAPGAPLISVNNLINNPLRFRARGDLGWRSGPWSAIAYVNYLNSYTNNTVTPAQKIDAWTTVDLHVGFDLGSRFSSPWLSGVRLSLDAQNLFNRDPPFVNISSGYDPQSANPIGRMVSFTIDKKW